MKNHRQKKSLDGDLFFIFININSFCIVACFRNQPVKTLTKIFPAYPPSEGQVAFSLQFLIKLGDQSICGRSWYTQNFTNFSAIIKNFIITHTKSVLFGNFFTPFQIQKYPFNAPQKPFLIYPQKPSFFYEKTSELPQFANRHKPP